MRAAAKPIKKGEGQFQIREGCAMLPDASHPVWEQIATGKRPLESRKPTVNLLIHSNKVRYEQDQSLANVRLIAEKTHHFFRQYEALFPAEVAQIVV
jgi:hypothetical protein